MGGSEENMVWDEIIYMSLSSTLFGFTILLWLYILFRIRHTSLTEIKATILIFLTALSVLVGIAMIEFFGVKSYD
jgi:hypothetical protein